MKKLLILGFFLLVLSTVFSESITGLVVNNPRLGENISVRGQFVSDANSYVLCKFEVKTAKDGNFVERWSDEYSFSDGSFYAERPCVEPPYFRGDDYNAVVTCGVSTAQATFNIYQPVSLAQPISKTWEYAMQGNNQQSILFFVSFIALIFIVVFGFAWFVKKGLRFNAG